MAHLPLSTTSFRKARIYVFGLVLSAASLGLTPFQALAVGNFFGSQTGSADLNAPQQEQKSPQNIEQPVIEGEYPSDQPRSLNALSPKVGGYLATERPLESAEPAKAKQKPMEEVVYPPDQPTAPEPTQPFAVTPNGYNAAQAPQQGTAQAPNSAYFAPAPVSPPAPHLVWIEGPKGQLFEDKTVKGGKKDKKSAKVSDEKAKAEKPAKHKKAAAAKPETDKKPDADKAVSKIKTGTKKGKGSKKADANKKTVTPPAPPTPPTTVVPAKPVTPPAAVTAPAPTPAKPVAPASVPPAPPAGATPPPPPPGAVPPPPPPAGATTPAPSAAAPAKPVAPPAPAAQSEEPVISVPVVTPSTPDKATPPAPAPAKPVDKPADKAPEKPAAAAPAANPAVDATSKAMAETAKPAGAQGAPALSITFKSTETTVPLTMSGELNKLAKQLIQNENQRLTLIAYASAAGDQVSTARRISLSRALSVRAFLIDAGVANLRINVQAEGDKNPGGEADRVDLFILTTGDQSKP